MYICQKNKMNLSIKSFRTISTLEAISFLVLLGIAMPLKYIAKIEAGEEIVRVVGMIDHQFL